MDGGGTKAVLCAVRRSVEDRMEKIDSKAIVQELDRFEQAINELRMKYDRYFFGLERRAPVEDREKMNKWVRRLLNLFISNTQLRFRREMLVSRFNTYARMWDRICAQIEAGTYRPDVMKADKRIGRIEARQVAAGGVGPRAGVAEPARPQSAAQPKAEKVAKAEKTSTAGRLYEEYIKARQKLGQPTSISRDRFEQMLNKQLEQLKKKHGFAEVELRVAIEGDKVKIKGRPKKKAG